MSGQVMLSFGVALCAIVVGLFVATYFKLVVVACLAVGTFGVATEMLFGRNLKDTALFISFGYIAALTMIITALNIDGSLDLSIILNKTNHILHSYILR